MFPSSPLLETALKGPLMADPSNLDALPIICQEDIDSPPLPPPIRWGGDVPKKSRPPLQQKNLTRMFSSSPLLETVLEGPLMADPSNLDALLIVCQEDIDSPPLPPPIRWGGCKDIRRNEFPSCPKKIISCEGRGRSHFSF
ncbi:hypothetical protein CDAR_38511 [Caerostris darwini]|uniref:Uncharacterized protein n=1 Tax=Caerostris darwini TaxID=1538125 RepID=A0AAV4URQ3_9ARAC|nr:hypothetical protein CDAR_38511 [Caerostris darwini]